jgi:hypothetical protein
MCKIGKIVFGTYNRHLALLHFYKFLSMDVKGTYLYYCNSQT